MASSNEIVHNILDYMKLQDRPSALELHVQRRDYIEGQDHDCLTISAPIHQGALLWKIVPSSSSSNTEITYDAESMETVVTLVDGVQYPSDTEGVALLVKPRGEALVVLAGWFVRKDTSVVARREVIRNALSVLRTK
jgi:hypothetical protein